MAGILVAADVVPWPPKEISLTDPSDEIGRKVVAEAFALHVRHPDISSTGLNRESERRTKAGGVNPDGHAFGSVLLDDGAIHFERIDIRIVNVGGGSHSNEQTLAIEGEYDVANPVVPRSRQVTNNNRPRAAGLQISVAIREADDRFRVADVNPLWIRTGRIKGYSERTFHVARKNGNFLRLAILAAAAENLDSSRLCFGHDQVSIRRDPNLARILQLACVKLNFEASRDFGPGVLRTRDDSERIRGRGTHRFRKIVNRNPAKLAGSNGPVIAKGGRACDHFLYV